MSISLKFKPILIAILTILLLSSSKIFAQNNKDSLQIYFELSDQYLESGNYAENLKVCLRALRLAEISENCAQISDSKRRVGIAHDYLKDHYQALKYLNTAFKQAEKCSIDSTAWRALRFMGGIYFGLNATDSAGAVIDSSEYYLNASLKKMLGSGKLDEIASNYGMLGEMYGRIKGDLETAEKNYLLSLDYAKRSKDKVALGYAHFRYAMHIIRNGNCDGTLHADTAYQLFQQTNELEGQLYILNGLAFAASKCGKAEDVYLYFTMREDVLDSIFSNELSNSVAQYQTLYETQNKELEIAKLEQKNRNKNYLLLSVFSVVSIGAIGLRMNYLKKKNILERKREQELKALQMERFREVLEAEEKERIRISRELHDSLGYLLSASKMNLSAIEIKDDPETTVNINKTAAIIDEASKEVRAISHNLMPATLIELGLNSAIRQMVNKIEGSTDLKIKLNVKLDGIIPDEKAISIYRIVQEIINNCIKHAKAKNLLLNIEQYDGLFSIESKDDGIGFDTNNINLSQGIGWKNIQSRVELMGGKINIVSAINKGTSIHISGLQ